MALFNRMIVRIGPALLLEVYTALLSWTLYMLVRCCVGCTGFVILSVSVSIPGIDPV